MTEFAEVIYETGAKSVCQVDDRDEFLAGLREHHRRAVEGEPGGPPGHPAERITKVFFYDAHPADFNNLQTLSADVLAEEVKGFLHKKDVVAIHELAAHVRSLSDAHTVGYGAHESKYKAEAKEELYEGWQ